MDNGLIEKLRAKFDEGKKIRILFVCLGNICRSPAAEGIFRHIVDKHGLSDRFVLDSCGFYGGHAGELPDRRMRIYGAERGYRFEHRSRRIIYDDFNDFDLILGMDRYNLDDLHEAAPSPEDEKKIMSMADFAVHYPEHHYVPDPYYEGVEGFHLVLNLLEDACARLFTDITGIKA